MPEQIAPENSSVTLIEIDPIEIVVRERVAGRRPSPNRHAGSLVGFMDPSRRPDTVRPQRAASARHPPKTLPTFAPKIDRSRLSEHNCPFVTGRGWRNSERVIACTFAIRNDTFFTNADSLRILNPGKLAPNRRASGPRPFRSRGHSHFAIKVKAPIRGSATVPACRVAFSRRPPSPARRQPAERLLFRSRAIVVRIDSRTSGIAPTGQHLPGFASRQLGMAADHGLQGFDLGGVRL